MKVSRSCRGSWFLSDLLRARGYGSFVFFSLGFIGFRVLLLFFLGGGVV